MNINGWSVVALVAALALVIATLVLTFANELRAALLCSSAANCLLMRAVRAKR